MQALQLVKSKRERNTLAKQIKLLASKDIRAAMHAAFRGEHFSDLQNKLARYYQILWERGRMKTPPQPENPWIKKRSRARQTVEMVDEIIRRDRAKLCRIFIDAVDSKDSERIIEIAEAVKFFKTFARSGDMLRYNILTFKEILDRTRSAATVRDVAEFVGWPDKDSQDGFSQLRRMCVELDFPLAPSRKIKPK